MIFVLLLIAAIVTGVRKGLFFMICVLFNLSVAIYVAVVSVPQLLRFSPGLSPSPVYAAGLLLVMTAAVFGGLQWLAVRLFLSERTRYFGSLLDSAASAVIGFVTGYVLWGFLLMLLSTASLAQQPVFEKYLTGPNAAEFARLTITDVCKFVVTASLDAPSVPVEEKVQQLLDLPQPE